MAFLHFLPKFWHTYVMIFQSGINPFFGWLQVPENQISGTQSITTTYWIIFFLKLNWKFSLFLHTCYNFFLNHKRFIKAIKNSLSYINHFTHYYVLAVFLIMQIPGNYFSSKDLFFGIKNPAFFRRKMKRKKRKKRKKKRII